MSYELPIGQGQLLSFRSHALNNVLGGWRLSLIANYQNGGFLGPFTGLCRLPAAGSCHLDYTPGFVGPVRINGAYGSGNPRTDSYINANAFQNAADYTYGTTPRHGAYGLRAPGGANENVALDKTFKLWKRTSLRLRADAFNVFNRTEFGGIITNYESPAFGRVTTQVGSPRQMQFEAYLNF